MIEAIIDSQHPTNNNKSYKKVYIQDEKEHSPERSEKSNKSNRSARSIISNLGQDNYVPIPNLVKRRTTALSTNSTQSILHSTKAFCTPWLLFILLVFITTLFVGGTYYYLWVRSNNRLKKLKILNLQSTNCRLGQFYDKGKCIKCPDESEWTGDECKIKQYKTAVNVQALNNKQQKQTFGNIKSKLTPANLKQYIHSFPEIMNNKQKRNLS